uniref:Transposase n=1 Tax=Lactococcus lactis subsp. lactis TaxID=1360 RepID=A0AAC9R4R1_LACLL
MTKYSFELKLKVVQDYDNGVGGCDYLAKKYHVTNAAIVRRWVKAYKELGRLEFSVKDKIQFIQHNSNLMR